MIECCLENDINHDRIKNELYRKSLCQVGTLFNGQPLCYYCYFHLHDLVTPCLTDNDELVRINRRKMYPEYAEIIDDLSEEEVWELLNAKVIPLQPLGFVGGEPFTGEDIEDDGGDNLVKPQFVKRTQRHK